MKNTVDSNPVRDAIDMPGLLARIARLEVEIGSIRQELVHSLGGPRLAFNADEVENGADSRFVGIRWQVPA